ncbi:helix-turn-helix transcriptional regulator [Pseudoclavibacter helvolus]|uniref:helix-turn-helix transcriptional regulator n=1 Tax=Pseudoclavibacter helvolus TaxID=255205 RepID=UPI000838A978|nr:helix-turn-helix transcriptional regulator [Pseudoclavibacter helvolus]
MDRAQLADFLRSRREALQPQDVCLTKGPRRRTAGLRREEVAALSDMTVDYYSRLEQSRGPQPSEQMLAAIARGLRLTVAERDHLFHLAGHQPPARTFNGEHVSPGLMRILDRLADTPAQVMTSMAETLVQTPAARALFGDETRFTGNACNAVYRWFTDPSTRGVYPESDHTKLSRAFVADLRGFAAQQGPGSRAHRVVDALHQESPEFAEIWADHEINAVHGMEKQVQHPELGVMTVQCQFLVDPMQGQTLLVLTATPGTDSYDKLQLLAVLGTQRLTADA